MQSVIFSSACRTPSCFARWGSAKKSCSLGADRTRWSPTQRKRTHTFARRSATNSASFTATYLCTRPHEIAIGTMTAPQHHKDVQVTHKLKFIMRCEPHILSSTAHWAPGIDHACFSVLQPLMLCKKEDPKDIGMNEVESKLRISI